MSLIICRLRVFSSCTGWANYCSCVSMAGLEFMECWAVPVCWRGMVWCGPMRGRWWALQKGNRLFQMAGLWWSAQLPQTWSSYSISPTSQPVITLSLPLCYAIPDPHAVSGLITRSLPLSVLFPHFLCLPTPSFCIQFLTLLLTRILWGYFVTMTMYLLPYSYTIVIWIVTSGLCSIQNWIRNAF